MSTWDPDRRRDERSRSSGSEYDVNHGAAREACCRECEATVAGNSKFCPNCGTRMQEACFGCGAMGTPGAQFCGECGADLINGLETQVTLFEEKLAESRRLLDELNCDKAIELLQPLMGAKHPILARYANDACEIIEQARTRRAEHDVLAIQLYEQSVAARECFEYQRCFQLLDEIPLSFRTEAIRDAHEESHRIVGEIERLTNEVASRSVKDYTPDWLEKIERLLELQPDHAKAKRAGELFRGYAHRRARERIGQDEHDRAIEILRLIPSVLTTDETQALLHQAREFDTLQWDLLHAPMVDRILIDVARRLHKIAPANGKFTELHERLSRYSARFDEGAVLPPARWTKPPATTPWECPVERLTDFGEMEAVDEKVLLLTKQQGSSLFPAFGLALQGLGKATIGINFLKGAKPLAIPGLAQPRSAWGLDLSPSGLKAIRLDIRKTDQELVVGACELIEHRKPLGQAGGEDERNQLIRETLEVFRSRRNKKLGRVCVSLPDVQSICRHVTAPLSNTQKLAEVMEYESRMQFSGLLGDVSWGYHPLEPVDESAPHHERRILLTAVKDASVQESLDVLRESKIKVDQVQTDWIALTNALIHLKHLAVPESISDAKDSEATAVLDLGSESSMLLLQSPGFLHVRPIRIGACSLTRSLAQEFKLPLADAEKLKRDPRSIPLLSRFYETLEADLENLVKDVAASIRSVSQGEDVPLHKLLIVGGGTQLYGLQRYFLYGR